jgi:hypothetical protein
MLLTSSVLKSVGSGMGSVIWGGYKEGCHNTQGEVMSEPKGRRQHIPLKVNIRLQDYTV